MPSRNIEKNKFALVAAAGVSMVGTIALGNKLVEQPIQIQQLIERKHEANQTLTIAERIDEIQKEITEMQRQAHSSAWVVKSSSGDSQYIASFAVNKQDSLPTYNQIVLFVKKGSSEADRLLLVEGAKKPKYFDGTEANSWAEIDKLGPGRYSLIGYDGSAPMSSKQTTEQVIDEFVGIAESWIDQIKNPNQDPRLTA